MLRKKNEVVFLKLVRWPWTSQLVTGFDSVGSQILPFPVEKVHDVAENKKGRRGKGSVLYKHIYIYIYWLFIVVILFCVLFYKLRFVNFIINEHDDDELMTDDQRGRGGKVKGREREERGWLDFVAHLQKFLLAPMLRYVLTTPCIAEHVAICTPTPYSW